jgi:hypothetical protein
LRALAASSQDITAQSPDACKPPLHRCRQREVPGAMAASWLGEPAAAHSGLKRCACLAALRQAWPEREPVSPKMTRPLTTIAKDDGAEVGCDLDPLSPYRAMDWISPQKRRTGRKDRKPKRSKDKKAQRARDRRPPALLPRRTPTCQEAPGPGVSAAAAAPMSAVTAMAIPGSHPQRCVRFCGFADMPG